MDIDLDICLTKIIGFNSVKRNCMAMKGYINSDKFVDWKFNNIKQCCDELSRRHINAGGCLWGDYFLKIPQGVSYLVNCTHLIVIPLYFNTLQADDIMYWYTYGMVYHKTDNRAG